MNSRNGAGNADNHYSQAQSSGKSHHPNVNYTSSVKKGNSGSKAIAQYPDDARIHAVFEQSAESEKFFDYSKNIMTTKDHVAEQQITAYSSKIQRGGHIQPFGFMIAVDEANAPSLLGITLHSVPRLERPEILTIGTDVKTLFKSYETSFTIFFNVFCCF
ncbi:Phytochrome B [Abeliophyllum distichum]|uniref:Phytochrome B n=1 Tax=Abeliophyllum distichum TaxID=126358 RepID=A0ABD1U4U8_9LAMI